MEFYRFLLFIILCTHQTLSPGKWVSSPSLSDGQHENKQTHRKTQQPLFRLFESHKNEFNIISKSKQKFKFGGVAQWKSIFPVPLGSRFHSHHCQIHDKVKQSRGRQAPGTGEVICLGTLSVQSTLDSCLCLCYKTPNLEYT